MFSLYIIGETPVWIGGRRDSDEDDYTWDHSGLPLAFVYWSPYSTYYSGFGGIDFCIAMETSEGTVQWDAFACGESKKAICAYDVVELNTL